MEKEFDGDEEGGRRFSVGKGVRTAVLFALVLALGFIGGVQVGAHGRTSTAASVISSLPIVGDGLSAKTDPALDFTDFWKVYNLLNERFVQTHASTTPVTAQSEVYGAIAGLTASYGDPYTVFFPPTEAKMFNEQIAGNFQGVGMEIGIKEGQLTVVAPLKNTPSERAGILTGDVILSIDGKATDGLSTDAAVKLIRGPKGTVVTFSMYRNAKVIEIKVTRDVIQVPTIDAAYDTKTGVYTISLYEFTANSASLFNGAFKDFKSSGATKLIVDLRGNPGGYLSSAVEIASHFLPKGTAIVTEDYKGKQENVVHQSYGTNDFPANATMVILMNQGSASASEILAGALQDNKVATLIGTRSFGKGSVQEVIDIGKAALKVTVARWLTPSGRSISDGGLTPDIKVERTQEDVAAGKDPQKDRAIQFLVTGK